MYHAQMEDDSLPKQLFFLKSYDVVNNWKKSKRI